MGHKSAADSEETAASATESSLPPPKTTLSDDYKKRRGRLVERQRLQTDTGGRQVEPSTSLNRPLVTQISVAPDTEKPCQPRKRTNFNFFSFLFISALY